jgi:hypothetical protein
VDVARAAMRERFAAEHCWVHSKRGFTLDQLRRGSTCRRYTDDDRFSYHPMDHVEYFRLARRPYRPVAILSHEYTSIECSQELALELGITATLLPASWYSPLHANAVLYMGLYSLCL